MKIAVIGAGKTGGEVVKLLDEEQVVGPFDYDHKPTVDALKKSDAIIIFVPGSAVNDIFDTVLESGTPAVWGSTGYEWPSGLDQQLKEKEVKWLRASNFSLGMNIVRQCLKVISEGSEMLNRPTFGIHEIHHVQKKDAPSGTAISWKKWLGKEVKITSERKGDIKGIHELHMKTDSESIWLKHEAQDRAVFAEGAIWSAEQIVKKSVTSGFHNFESLFDTIMGRRAGNA